MEATLNRDDTEWRWHGMVGDFVANVKEYFQENKRTCKGLFLIYLFGVLVGVLAVNGIGDNQKSELLIYFDGFVELFTMQSLNSGEMLRQSAMSNYGMLILMGICGISIVGFPLIYLILMVRGFLAGFASGIIMGVAGVQGIVFVACTLLPKEMIFVPCLIVCGVSMIRYARNLFHYKSSGSARFADQLKRELMKMLGVSAVGAVVMLLGVLMESYAIPLLVRALLPLF